MRCLRSSLFFVTGVLLFASGLAAQTAGIASRITAPVDEKSLVSLQGNVPSVARAEFDRGEAPAATEMSHVRLVLARTGAQQAALDKYDAELLNKSSPNYHKWLTPEEFGKLYGPADADIAILVSWLQSHGLQVDPVDPGRTTIAFSGSVAQIEQALHTSIHAFNRNGEEFLSNIVNPSIPSALAGVVSGIARLNTIQPRPQHVTGQMGTYSPSTHRLQPAVQRGPQADLTTGTASSGYSFYVVPGDAATIYDTPNTTFNANYTTGTSYDGTGVTIGIGGQAIIDPTIVADYRTKFVGDTKQPTISNDATNPATSSTGGDADESYLDNEIAGGLAPGATIHFYTSSNIDISIADMLTDNTVDIFSLSYGLCELGGTTADNHVWSGWWQQASTQGIAVMVSTGDSGSAGCDNNNSETVATFGLMVSGLASTPYNIAVGGTDFAGLVATSSSFTTYVSTTDGTLDRTALKYIPESTWNDSTSVNTTISVNVPITGSSANIVAGGGGASNCSTNTGTSTTTGTCTSGYAKPVWQRGMNVPADGVRDLPDVALMAGDGADGAAWLVCSNDTGTVSGVTVTADCTTQSNGSFYFLGVGGTSAATPAFAGMLAMVQQKTGAKLGLAAKELYDLFNGTHASVIFHDITVGNNSVPCTASTPNCATNTKGNAFLTGYNTSAGYDLATGMGSVDAAQLVTYWGTALGPGTTTVGVVPSASSIPIASALTVVATVTGSAAVGNPTGTVTLTGGGYTSAAQNLTASGADAATYTFSVPGNSFTQGSDTLTVTYSGDVDYATKTGTAPLTVTGPTFTLSATNVTLMAGATSGNSSTVTVTPVLGYTGTVALTAAVTASPAGAVSAPILTGSNVTITNTTPQTGTIQIATTAPPAIVRGKPGSAWYKAAGSTALAALLFFFLPLGWRRGRRILSVLLVITAAAFTVIGCGGGSSPPPKTTPSVTVSPATGTISASASLSVAITVSGGTTPATGSVTLSGGGYTSSATALTSGAATINIPANSLAVGTDTLTASYSGDSNYNPNTGMGSVTVNKPGTTTGAYTITVTGTDTTHSNITATTTFTLTVN